MSGTNLALQSPLRRLRTSNCVQYSCVSSKQYRGWPQQQQRRFYSLAASTLYNYTTRYNVYHHHHFEAEAYFREAFFLGLDEWRRPHETTHGGWLSFSPRFFSSIYIEAHFGKIIKNTLGIIQYIIYLSGEKDRQFIYDSFVLSNEEEGLPTKMATTSYSRM